MAAFLDKLGLGLRLCGIFPQKTKQTLLLAVSGGIDSMVMLHAVRRLLKAENTLNTHIAVISINHNIRPAAQTGGDALFVQNYCNAEGIPCTVKTVSEGYISALALKRKQGIEEAARFVRYQLLEQAANEVFTFAPELLDFSTAQEEYAPAENDDLQNYGRVCLAHNRDDQLETLLQRFFQGAAAGISGKAAAGISRQRGIFCRPLLDISRKEIETYAAKQKIPFREDSSNLNLSYYRNNLRQRLIPFLNEVLPGWDKAVLRGAEKSFAMNTFIEDLAKKMQWEIVKKGFVRLNKADFYQAAFPIRIRLLYKGFAAAGIGGRISYSLVQAAADGQKRVRGCGIEITAGKTHIQIQNTKQFDQIEKTAEKNSFCIEIIKEGHYTIPAGIIAAQSLAESPIFADNRKDNSCIGPFSLPLRIRSKKTGDSIRTAAGGHKSLKKIWNEWGLAVPYRQLVPVIEQNGSLVCIWGALYDYPNWYVRQTAENNIFLRLISDKK